MLVKNEDLTLILLHCLTTAIGVFEGQIFILDFTNIPKPIVKNKDLTLIPLPNARLTGREVTSGPCATA